MKKILSIALVFLMAFSFAACKEETPPSVFADFESAIYSTPASVVTVSTKLESKNGELNSLVTTTFNPDGSAKISYTVEKFAEDFNDPDGKVTVPGEVTLNKDGTYSDGGAFAGQLNVVSGVNLSLVADKMDYKIEGNVLSGTVKAENTADIFGVSYPVDVYFILTINANRVVSITLNYTLPEGAVTAVCSYN
jgi:hypothetical protein